MDGGGAVVEDVARGGVAGDRLASPPPLLETLDREEEGRDGEGRQERGQAGEE